MSLLKMCVYIGNTVVRLTGGVGLGSGLEHTECLQSQLTSVCPYTEPGILLCNDFVWGIHGNTCS